MVYSLEEVTDISNWTQFWPGSDNMPDGFELEKSEAKGLITMRKTEDVLGMCGWSSPFFRVIPGQYYSLAFHSCADSYGFWEAQFFKDDEKEPSNFYSNGFPDTAGTRREFEFYFQGKFRADRCRLVFWPGAIGSSSFGDFELNHSTKVCAGEHFKTYLRETQRMVEGVTMPLVNTGRLDTILKKLKVQDRQGGIDIVTYGDSVAFDMGNMPLSYFLEKNYPGTSVRIHTRGKGSTGWDELGDSDAMKQHLWPCKPDLVVLQGVSTEPHLIPETLPVIIDAIRARTDADVLLMTDHRSTGIVQDEKGGEYWDVCADKTRGVAKEYDCALVDWRAFMKSILNAARPPGDRLRWYMRDAACHLNDRGRALVLRLLTRAFGVDLQ